MKKLLLGLLMIGSLVLTGCSTNSKEYYNLKEFIEFRLYDTGQLVQQWKADGDKTYNNFSGSIDSQLAKAARDLDNHSECTLYYNSQMHTYTFYGRYCFDTGSSVQPNYVYTYKLVYQGANISISYLQ